MKNWMISAPLALMLATTAVAQDATGTDQPEGSGFQRSDWSTAVNDAFIVMDNDKMTMRSDEELATGWKGMAQADRDMVMADCTKFQAEVAAGTEMGGEATGTMTDDATTGTDSNSGTSGDATETADLSTEDMTRLCNKVLSM